MADDVIAQARKVPFKKRVQAFFFVLIAFAFWFLFAWLTRVVVKCAPTKDFGPCAFESTPPTPLTWPDALMLITTLVLAVWAARRAVFPPDD